MAGPAYPMMPPPPPDTGYSIDAEIALFRTDGQPLLLPIGIAHVFSDRHHVWLVESGSIDFFAVRRQNGAQSGPREYLFSVSDGDLIWGINQSADQDGICILALPATDIQLLCLTTVDIGRMAEQPETAPIVADALESWIMGLTRGVTKYISPRSVPRLVIAPGDTIALDSDDRVLGRKGVVWVQVSEGTVDYLDVQPITSAYGSLIPVTPDSWLHGGPGTRTLRGLTTLAVIQSEDMDDLMDEIHGWMFYCLAFTFFNAASMESARLGERAGQIAGETERSLIQVTNLLNPHKAPPPALSGFDALLDCCTLVGRAASLTISAPQEGFRRRLKGRPQTIVDIATASNVRVREVKLTGRWWTQDNGPLVGYRQDGEPVALLPTSPTTYALHEPAESRDVTRITADVAAGLRTVAHTFYPNLPNRAVTPLDVFKFCFRQCRTDLITTAITGALGGLIATAIPVATGYLFDDVVPSHQSSQLVQVCLAIMAAAFTATVFRYASNIAQLRVAGKVAGTLQAAFMDRLLRLPNNFFSGYSTGDLVQRTMMVEVVRKSITGVVLNSIVAGIFSIFSFGLLLFYAPSVAIIAAALLLGMGGMGVWIGVRRMKAIVRGQELSGKLNSIVLQILSGITKMRMAGAEERAFNGWARRFVELRTQEVAARQVVALFRTSLASYEILALTAVFSGIALLGGDSITTGNFLAFITAFSSLYASCRGLVFSLISVIGIIPLFARARPILEAAPENDGRKTDPGLLTGACELTEVSFRYSPSLPYIARGLSLKIRAGEFVALVGPSGSGKSTLMRLLLGFERPETGGIYFDGQDLQTLTLQAVRRQIGVVLQNGKLMPGSIYENIRGATNATLDDCWDVATLVGLDEDIRAMPMGMHTILTDGTTSLSGGQTQRILLARAIVVKPRILLLDEATSALDNQTQDVVSKSLDRLSITRIVIAHRLSTIVNADRIFVLQDGRVTETGTYGQLLDRGGLFTELVKRQTI